MHKSLPVKISIPWLLKLYLAISLMTGAVHPERLLANGVRKHRPLRCSAYATGGVIWVLVNHGLADEETSTSDRDIKMNKSP